MGVASQIDFLGKDAMPTPKHPMQPHPSSDGCVFWSMANCTTDKQILLNVVHIITNISATSSDYKL